MPATVRRSRRLAALTAERRLAEHFGAHARRTEELDRRIVAKLLDSIDELTRRRNQATPVASIRRHLHASSPAVRQLIERARIERHLRRLADAHMTASTLHALGL